MQPLSTDNGRRSSNGAAVSGSHGSTQEGRMKWGFDVNPEHNDDDDDNEDALGEADTDVPLTDSAVKSQVKQEGGASGSQPKRKRPLKLTASQRERKRAIDREAQRSIRIKTKNYIAHLESLVKAMEQNDANGPDGENNRTRELMNQLRQSQEEVRRLREAMLGVQRVLGGALGDATRSALGLENLEQRQASSSSSPPSGNEQLGARGGSFTATTRPSIEPSGGFWMPPPQEAAHAASSITMVSDHASPPTMHPARPAKDPSLRQYEGEMFYYAEYHLGRVYSTTSPGAFSNRPFDEDIIVRAVIEGWAAVEERYPLDLGWQVLQEIDQVIFPDVGIVERMAALRLLRMKLMHTVNNRVGVAVPRPQGLPQYMTAEVVQQDNRANVIDSFVWPGFRKLLVETPQRYITNELNESFRHNLKFLWPFDVSESYTKDPITSLYCSSPEFMRRQADIRCWTMKRVFFNGYEELWENIPAYEADIQKSLPGPGMPPTGVSTTQQQRAAAGGHGSFNMQGDRVMGLVEEHEVVEDDGYPDGSGPGPAVLPSSDPTAWVGHGGVHHHHAPHPATTMAGFWPGMDHGLPPGYTNQQLQHGHMSHRGSQAAHGYPS